MTNSYFELLQLNDATFPIGSYAFSWGLETFVQQEIIFNAQSAEQYIKSELEQSFLYSELLTARFAYENCNCEKKLQFLDKLYGASKAPFELREGSKKLATRFLKLTETFGKINNKAMYFPVAYGSYCGKNKFPLKESLSAFTYSQTSAKITTAVKLVPLSQTDGQKILFSLIKEFPTIIKACLTLKKSDLCRSVPGIDIRAMQHEFLYTRLYSN